MKTFLHIERRVCYALTLLLITTSARAYTVTNLVASYKNGQVFLTWTSPSASNLKYNVYRSTKKITSSTQIKKSIFLGYVRDNSAQNIRESDYFHNYYFIIDPTKGPLASNQGLYVATCVDNLSYYYAVTITDLGTNIEDKTITVGSNSLSTTIQESINNPQPILQQSGPAGDGSIQYQYAQWGNNQSPSHYPAFNNAGSYAYNFSIFDRGNSSGGPLYVYFKDNNPFSTDGTDLCDNCSVLKMDDWLPNGSDTYWLGWQTNYDMYSTTNPVPKSGTIVTYSQARVKKTLQWVRSHWAIDSNKVYCTGNSHNGFGAMLTSELSPEQIACIYVTSSPTQVKPAKGDPKESLWCKGTANFPTDVIDPKTGQAILIWNLMDARKMYRVEYTRGVPFNTGVNGKNDVTEGWVQQYHWYDSLNISRQGGVWYWDQRVHSGSGANFTDSETTPDYERYAINLSYPAFAYCSINQNPGNGDPLNGDPYGAINGYLDWVDQSIDDEACQYNITCFVKDFYVGGVLDAKQYDSCTTDITLRRVQKFYLAIGSVIQWSVSNSSGIKVQNGSFVYNGGPVTIYAAKIYKTNSYISFNVVGCQKNSPVENTNRITAYVATSGNQNELIVNLPNDDQAQLKIFDLTGRLVFTQNEMLETGLNAIPLPALNSELYIATIEGKSFRDAVKFQAIK